MIKSNSAQSGWGAGVAINSSGTFYMESGKISGCQNMGVSIGPNGKFFMTGGEISSNGKCGIWINGSGTEVSLASGRIADNKSDSYRGAGIHYETSSDNTGTLLLDNMEIVNNTSGHSSCIGAGIFVVAGTKVTLKDKVVIWGNKDKNGKDSNAYFWNNDNNFTIEGTLQDGSYIGVCKLRNGTVAAGNAEANKGFFASDDPTRKILIEGTDIIKLDSGTAENPTPPTIEQELGPDPIPDFPSDGNERVPAPEEIGIKHEHSPCGETTCNHNGHVKIEYKALAEGTTVLPDGSAAYLTEDMTELTVTGTVNLCLNGHTVNSITIDGGTLIFCDCQGGGTVQKFFFRNDGKLTLPVPRPKTPYMVEVTEDTAFVTGWGGSMGDPSDYFTAPEDKEIKVDNSNLIIVTPTTPPNPVIVTVIKPNGDSVEITVKSDGTIDTLPTNEGPVPVGKAPDGWTTKPDGSGSKIDENTVFTSDTIVYPHWKDCEHSWQETETTPAACTEAGRTVRTCAACHETQIVPIDPLAHSFTESDWKKDDNFHWHECSRCGAKTDIAAHTVSGTPSSENAATCTSEGSRTFNCVCGQKTTVKMPALGHDFSGAWKHDSNQHWRQCSRCAAEDTEKEAHVWTAAVTLEPTTEAEGEETLSCICGAEETRTIPKLTPVGPGPDPADGVYNATFVFGPHKDPEEVTGKQANEAVTIKSPGERIGFTFVQWNWFALSGGGSGTAEAEGRFTMPASNVVFTALWKQNQRTTLHPGETIILDDGTKIENDSGTVTIDRDGDGTPETTIRPPDGTERVDVVHKDDEGKTVIELPGGSTVNTDKEYDSPNDPGGETERKPGPTVTVGDGGGEVDMDGNVTLPPGSTINDGETEVKIDEGTGKVEPDGSAVIPEGGKVTVTEPGGDETEITIPKTKDGEEPPAISAERYTVSFDMQEHGTPVPAVSGVLSGSKLTRPKDPFEEGFTFGGWYYRDDDPDEGESSEKEWKFDTDAVLGDMTLYARWTSGDSSAKPSITKQPGSIDGLVEGDIPADTKLTVTVDDPPEGGGTITYQWFEKDDNGEFKPIPGADGPSYTIPEDTGAGTHEYYCKVTNTEEGREPASVDARHVTVDVEPAQSHEHVWSPWEMVVEPTEEVSGLAERECSAEPPHTETKQIPVLTDESVWKLMPDEKEPTNDEDGSRTYVSDEYGEVTVIIPALGHKHNWKPWVIIVEPTLDTEGAAQRECDPYTAHKDTKVLPVLTDTSVWTPGKRVEPGENTPGSQEYNSDYGTVTITIPATGPVKPDDPNPPSGDKVPLGPGEEVTTDDGTKVKRDEDGGTVTIDKPGEPSPDIVIKVPLPPKDGDVLVDTKTGEVEVPDGSEVDPGGKGPKVELPGGGKVDPDDGGVTPKLGGSVVVDGGDGKPEITVTPPSGGKITPDGDGNLNVPGGSTVKPGGSGPEIKLPEGSGGKVDPDEGTVSVPPGTTITGGKKDTKVDVTDGSSTVKDNTITFPGGGKVTVTTDGAVSEVEIPEGGSISLDGIQVDGTVVEGESPLEGIDVELRKGRTVYQKAKTNADGKFILVLIPEGEYNIVATRGEVTKTVLITVENTDLHVEDIRMPNGNKSSVVDVKNPDGKEPLEIVVGNVDIIAESSPEQNVTVTFTVAEQNEEQVGAAVTEQIRRIASVKRTLMFLDMLLEKQVNGGTSMNIGGQNNQLLQIVIPFPTADRHNIAVYRYHDSQAETLREQKNSDGEYIVISRTSITIFAKKFSTYAIGFTEDEVEIDEPTVNPPSGGGSGGGSSKGPSGYQPVITGTQHGTVTVSPQRPVQGSKVTVTLTPDMGYQIKGLTVTDAKGNPVDLVNNGDGTYTFTQPNGRVTIQGEFQPAGGVSGECPKNETCPIAQFTDASPMAWYHDGVHYCLETGMMRGYGNGLFRPNSSVTRAEAAQILFNREGQPETDGGSTLFNDVPADMWCFGAVSWGQAKGVLQGYSSGAFGPGDSITREQLAAVLWRYAGSPAVDGELAFTDSNEIAAYAKDAVRWAVQKGIISGYNDGSFGPKRSATRAETASMLARYAGELDKN